MGIMMSETCWDRSLIINTRLDASWWFLSFHSTFHDARSQETKNSHCSFRKYTSCSLDCSKRSGWIRSYDLRNASSAMCYKTRAFPRYKYLNLSFSSRNQNLRKIIYFIHQGQLVTYIFRTVESRSCISNPFATWYYKELVGQHQAPTALSPGKTRYAMYWSFRASVQTWTAWKITSRPVFGPRTIQSLASRMAACGRVKKLQIDLTDILDTILRRLDWYFDTVQCRLHWFFEHCPI